MTSQILLLILGMSTSMMVCAQEVSLQYYEVKENLPNQRVDVRVIEEDLSLRANQNVISQQLIFHGDFPEGKVPELSELVAQRRLSDNEIYKNTGVPKPLWIPMKDHWDESDEDAYSQWVATEVNGHFNESSGLLADCADVGQLFRWVYARNHLLPVANSLTGSGKLFGHFSGSRDWDSLPTSPDWKKDERFKAAMRYLFDNSYTRTLVEDIYPTFIQPQFVRPGSMFMIIRPHSGHTQTIVSVDPKNGIQTAWGNEPSTERIDETQIIIEFKNQQKFGRHRTPFFNGTSWELTAPEQMYGYATEQFNQKFRSQFEYVDWVDQRLGVHEPDTNRLYNLVSDFEQAVASRYTVTVSSLYPCFYNRCDIDSAEYNDFSTFSRDARIQKEIAEIRSLILKLGPKDPVVVTVQKKLKDMGPIIKGLPLTYLNLIEDEKASAALNSDPTVSFLKRWGIDERVDSANLNFMALSAVVKSLLWTRNGLVARAYSYCHNGCDETTTQIRALNTKDSDREFQFIFQKLQESVSANGLSLSLVLQVKDGFAKDVLNYVQGCPTKSAPKVCTFQDVVWQSDSASRISNWSYDPKETADKRWGF